MGIGIAERGHHRLPEALAHSGIGLLELDLVEEAALEGRVEVLRQVGGGYHDAVQRLHLLQDDILDGVLHLVHGTCSPLSADAYDGIGLVEEEDGRGRSFADKLAVTVEQCLDVLLRITYPLALESESFDYIIDNDPEHENWHISVLESKLKPGKEKLKVLYACIEELYSNLCKLNKIDIDTDKDLFIYRFSGLVKQEASFLPSEKIRWNGKNVLLGHIIRCLTSDDSNPPEKMGIAAEFFESKTGKSINLASARHVNVSNFEKEKIDIDPNFVEAVEILKKSGFINAEYTLKRR